MVTDGQVRKLRHCLDQGIPLAHAARRTGMSDKTARRYRDDAPLPSARTKRPRTYRTRPDPFAAVWTEVEGQLRAEPRLTAKTLFDWLRRRHPGQFLDSHRRTFERRVRQWRAAHGPGQLAIFRQIHEAGDLAASDFTCMNSLGITVGLGPGVASPSASRRPGAQSWDVPGVVFADGSLRIAARIGSTRPGR